MGDNFLGLYQKGTTAPHSLVICDVYAQRRFREKKMIWLSIARTFHILKVENNFVIVLLCKAYPFLDEKVGKCVDFVRYFDFFVVFEMFRGERIRHGSLVCVMFEKEVRTLRKHVN